MAGRGAKLRAVAAETIDAVVSQGQSVDSALAGNEADVRADDRPLLRMIVYGTLRHHWQLSEWIDVLLSRPLKKRDSVVHALLASGLHQLTALRVPDHAVVSETVEATRQLRRPKMAGLVNACLRRFMREGMAEKTGGSPASEFDHPEWLIDQLRADWPEDWQAVLNANNERAPMWLRVNGLRGSVDDYLERLDETGIAAGKLNALSDGVRLEQPANVDALPGFRDGDVSVQDGGAQLAADWLPNIKGARILDACAAPGGKTCHLLERGAAEVVAVELDEKRMQRVAENLERLGLNATICVADASKTKDWWDGEPFDSILLDAPCSATGVIRRHPDIKLLRRPEDIGALADLQGRLLDALWPLLRPGGHLLYVTCSVLAAENDHVTSAFLQRQADASETNVLLNNNIRDLMRDKACGHQLLPGTAGLDGFYFACLEKGPGTKGPEKVS